MGSIGARVYGEVSPELPKLQILISVVSFEKYVHCLIQAAKLTPHACAY
jgi:hypothetical protein